MLSDEEVAFLRGVAFFGLGCMLAALVGSAIIVVLVAIGVL